MRIGKKSQTENVSAKIHVLTDYEDLGWGIKEHLTSLGYDCYVSTTIVQFYERISADEKYLLIVDYLLSEGDCRQLLLDLLNTDVMPLGLVIMSGLAGFKDFLDEVAKHYTQQDIPFLFLEKPFDEVELGELLLRLTKGFDGRFFGCLRFPKYNYQDIRGLGPLLIAARENLGLARGVVASCARKRGLYITEKRLEEIEADESGANIDCNEWFNLTNLLYESSDSCDVGFEPWQHLRRVRYALQDKSYPFPMTFVLRRKLVELARRDQMEEQDYDVTNFASPQSIN